MRKCGNCFNFVLKSRDEIDIAIHAPHISQCQPGLPHCLGGQVRGSCTKWEERAEKGYPMPWGDGPMVESTFFCRLWEKGGPRVKAIGSYNVRPNGKSDLSIKAILSLVLPSFALFQQAKGSPNQLDEYEQWLEVEKADTIEYLNEQDIDYSDWTDVEMFRFWQDLKDL